MKGRKTWQLGYAAGVIDSDGCISIQRQTLNKTQGIYTAYRLSVIVAQTDGRAVDFLYGTFGGSLHKRNGSREASSGCRPFLYRWELRGEQAVPFLKRIVPFLKIKKEQAELGIRFQTARDCSGRNRFTGIKDTTFSESCYQRMKVMKTIWAPSAAAETKWNGSQVIPVGSDSPVRQETN